MHSQNLRSLVAASIVVVLAVVPFGALAGATDPTLALIRAASTRGRAGRTVQLVGVLPAEDLIQRAQPIQVVIHNGGAFARFDLAGGVWTGFSPELADGLDAADWPAVVAASAPAADGRVVATGADRVEVLLPTAYTGGPSSAQLFLLKHMVLSNAISLAVAQP